DDAKQRSEASDKALTEKRTRIERELNEEQGNAKIRAAKIIEHAEQRLAEAADRVHQANEIERHVSEQVSLTFSLLDDPRAHFAQQGKLRDRTLPTPAPQPKQIESKTPTNGK